MIRDVLGFSAKEAAEALDATVPSVNGSLRRARAAIAARLPDQDQQVTLRALGDRELRERATRFADSFERGDVHGILATLAEDATFSMPPFAEWCRGREAIAKSWLMPGGSPPRLRYRFTRANGQPALGVYLIDAGTARYVPLALDVLAFRGRLISDVVAFRMPDLFPRFGLPPSLALTRTPGLPARRPG